MFFIPISIIGLIIKNTVLNKVENQFIQDLSSYGLNKSNAVDFWSGKEWGTVDKEHEPFAKSILDGPVLSMYYKKNNYGRINNIIMAPSYINENIKINIDQKSTDFTLVGTEYLIYCSATKSSYNNKNLDIQDAPVFLISDFIGERINNKFRKK